MKQHQRGACRVLVSCDSADERGVNNHSFLIDHNRQPGFQQTKTSPLRPSLESQPTSKMTSIISPVVLFSWQTNPQTIPPTCFKLNSQVNNIQGGLNRITSWLPRHTHLGPSTTLSFTMTGDISTTWSPL